MNSAILTWAKRHGVTDQALFELQQIFGIHATATTPKDAPGESESAVQARVRLAASKRGILLFRNNVGVLRDDTGRPVRYGLANDTKELNRVIKSGDLIGGRPVMITPEHVGHVILQFVSRECKPQKWRYSGTEREIAQLNWAQLIAANGGDAAFCTSDDTF